MLLAVSREASACCCLGAGISAELSPCFLCLLGYAASETHLLSSHSPQACCVPAQLPAAPGLASEDRETGQRRSQIFLGKCSTPSPEMLLVQVYNDSIFARHFVSGGSILLCTRAWLPSVLLSVPNAAGIIVVYRVPVCNAF